MPDTLDPADDAPLTTSKHPGEAVDAAIRTEIDKPAQGGADTLIGRTVTINRPREELFAYWRDFTRLASFMDNIERVDVLDRSRSHWVVKAPGGRTVEWDARITEERENEFIAWTSEDGADVPNSGRVDFRDAQGGRGTVVTATILYDPPGGLIGKVIAKMFQREPAIQARRDLRRFKQLMETGEIATGARNRRLFEEGKELMRALVWHGKHDVRVDTVDDPEILNPRDAIIKITSTAICGSDLHLYDGYIPTMQKGDILGHEFMGEVVETGAGSTLKKGQRVVVPFTISCGSCFHCGKHQYSACDNALPADNQDIGQELYGQPMAGLFGYSHLTGGYSGGQAEYVRVPFSDVGPLVIPDGVEDEKVLFLSDILPTGWMAAENADIEPGDTVAVWGCGPVGLFAVQSAFLMGAERVIAIDHFPRRLELARKFGAETINFEETSTYEALLEMTGGIGPDACIDSVGLEAHGFFVDNIIDQIKASTFLGTDRIHSIRQAILACRKGGRVSMPAVYGGFVDKFPLGAFMEKGLTLKTGQTHVQHYMPALLNAVMEDKVDTTFLISHTLPLGQAPDGYKMFHDNQNEVTKVVLKPGMAMAAE